MNPNLMLILIFEFNQIDHVVNDRQLNWMAERVFAAECIQNVELERVKLSTQTKLAVKKVKLKVGRKAVPKKIKIVPKDKSTRKSSRICLKHDEVVAKTDSKDNDSCKENSLNVTSTASKSPRQDVKPAENHSTPNL